MGVDKAVQYVNKADFIIYVVDITEELQDDDLKIMELLKGKSGVILFNKSDLDTHLEKEEVQKRLDWHIIPFSNKSKTGVEELIDYIKQSFLKGDITYNDQVYITSLRHKEAVESALTSLKQVLSTIEDGMPEDFYTIDMMDAYKKLGLINGETASEDLVNKIFKDFCMGK